MKQYLQQLLPRLHEFSQRLDHTENFVEKPWVLIDEDGNRHVYVFQRDKSLVMSVNGHVTIGSWQYIQAAQSLLIEKGKEKILLNNAFIEKEVMILRMDGSPDNILVLMNESVIPDLDALRYIKELVIRTNFLKELKINGKTYYFADAGNEGIGNNTVFMDESLNKTADSFTLNYSEKVVIIQDGAVRERYFIRHINTVKGAVTIHSKSNHLLVGDAVFLNGQPAPDGVYNTKNDNEINKFSVKYGSIISVDHKTYIVFLVFGAVITIALIASLIIGQSKNTDNTPQPITPDNEPLTVDTMPVTKRDTGSVSIGVGAESSTDTECKVRVATFLVAINDRNFTALTDYFPAVVPKYYNDRNLSATALVHNIQQYWTETLSKGFIFIDTVGMVVRRQHGQYSVSMEQFQNFTGREDGIPMAVNSNVEFVLSPVLKITSVTGNVIKKEYDYYKLFGIADNDYRMLPLFVAEANVADFERIFDVLTQAGKITFKKAVIEAICEQFGGNTPIGRFRSAIEKIKKRHFVATNCHYNFKEITDDGNSCQ